jgi:hypothetical protein
MNKIENDILNQVELEGLTQKQVDSMSNFEIKEFQREQSDSSIADKKKKVEFSIVSTLFFLLVTAFVYSNPIFTVYTAIAPALLTIAFSIKLYASKEHLKTEKISRAMLESFYEDSEL